ncbi:astacin [Ostertagia ostertagi]
MLSKTLNTSDPTAEMTSSPEGNTPGFNVPHIYAEKLQKINHDHVIERGHSIPEINEKSGVAEELFQGDILLAKPHVVDVSNNAGDGIGGAGIGETSRSKRQAVTDPDLLWNDGIVYYYFNDSISNNLRTIFLKAAELWEKDSCVKFEYNDKATDRILVHEGNGCLSSVGKIGGEQQISLGEDCDSSPSDTEIEVEVLSFLSTEDYYNHDGCVYGGVEIKTNKDQRLTGYRFCSKSTDGTRLRSHTNRTPIITWDRWFGWEVTLGYRHVSKSELRPTPRTVQPFPTTTRTPPPDYSFWTSGRAAHECVDYPTCPPHVNTVGTCNDPSLEVYCPKFCNLCYTPRSTNSEIGARRSPTNK